jgi:hypothetical protein
MLKRYGDKALKQSDLRVDELTAAGDHDGVGYCRRRLARQHDTARTAALIGTHPKRRPALAGVYS